MKTNRRAQVKNGIHWIGGLAMALAMACGHSNGTDNRNAASDTRASASAAVETASTPTPIICANDHPTTKTPSPALVAKGPDVHYRAPAADKAALKAKEQLASEQRGAAPSAPAQIDPKMAEREARYLEALGTLRAKHGVKTLEQAANNAAFEKERSALKDQMLGSH